MAFRRPGELRIELPAATGLRLVVVARNGQLTAVFPKARAFFEGRADPEILKTLIGVELEPREIMDLFVGVGSPRLRALRVAWGPALPARVEATLPDGTVLKARILAPEAGEPLPDGAFSPPPHDGFRAVPIEEARELLERV
jgi:hypothetical protein